MFLINEDRFYSPDLYRIVHHTINSHIEIRSPPFGLRSVPTHTEDGIPIRKLYVSNLPPKTTRTELFGVFAQYGFIKSCWLRMGEKGPNRHPKPTYAFVTYSNAADAHKALQAPVHEKTLRGCNLKISPADSWHQPVEDANGRVCWKSRSRRNRDSSSRNSQSHSGQQDCGPAETSSDSGEVESSENVEVVNQNFSEPEEEPCYTILDILNRDCLTQILTYVPIRDLIRSERVSKRWREMIEDYLHGIRTFKTSWWHHGTQMLTTAVLRHVLQRLGPALLRLHIDHHWSALNDRTAHTIGKFCPNLEELKVASMHTKNWNPLIYGCKLLKNLEFVSCNKLTDSSLVRLVKSDSSIESLTVAHNTHVTGLFLTGSNPPKLNSLALYNCYSLQGTVLRAAIDTLPNLTCLKLDACPISIWKIMPSILKKVPKLEELSLTEYGSLENCVTAQDNENFCESLTHLTELKIINLSRNIYITNVAIKQIAQTCKNLESLDVSSCNAGRNINNLRNDGVGDDGVGAVCSECHALRRLDVSYLAALTDQGLRAAARCQRLTVLVARGCPALSHAPFSLIVNQCPNLAMIDACGCENVCEQLVFAAEAALAARPRTLTLWLAGTAAAARACNPLAWDEEFPNHQLLSLNLTIDRSNPHFRPDFVDRIFEDSSEDSFDLYDPDEFNDILTDEEFYIGDELEDYEDGLYAYGLPPELILI